MNIMQQKLDSVKGDAILLIMAAQDDARLGLMENGIDAHHYDNQELLLLNTVEGIRTLLSSNDYPIDVAKHFALIGITA